MTHTVASTPTTFQTNSREVEAWTTEMSVQRRSMVSDELS